MGTLRIETNLQFASMRQIHAAIEHMERGDFECATTLADPAKCMLADADALHFLQILNEVSRSHEMRAAGAVTGAERLYELGKTCRLISIGKGSRMRSSPTLR